MPNSGIVHQTRDLSRRLLVALFTPMLLLLAMAVVLWLQLSRMSDDAKWVDHTDQVLNVAASLQRDIVDQENGLRGFLLSGDQRFLEPYHKANPAYLTAQLRQLVADNPPQVDRVDQVRQRYEDWHTLVSDIPQSGRRPEVMTLDAMLTRKARMDMVRDAVKAVVTVEQDLHRVRSKISMDSAQVARNLFIGLFIAVAAALAFLSRRQLSTIADTYRGMLTAERDARAAIEVESWLRAGQAHTAEQTQGDLTVEQLGERVLRTVAEYVHADVGAFFTSDHQVWRRRAGFALDVRSVGTEKFGLGEGLVGRAGAQGEIIHLKEVPADYLVVRSGTGGHAPVEVVLVPALVDKVPQAVIELGFLHPVEPRALDLLRRIGESLAIAVRSTVYKERLRDLLEESQRQAEELQTQQEELRVTNEELAEQTNALREANVQSEERQEELEQTNARLEEQTSALQLAQRAIAEKAAEAERATRYKSEFLANMSHELRTPLNSALILSKLLSANKDGNLSAEQVRFAETIHSAGQDLLALINDILDLSKIEAGMAEIRPATLHLSRLRSTLLAIFEPVARERKLTLNIVIAPGCPQTIETDTKWIEQILRNLLSNAMKFTHQGEVALHISGDGPRVRFAVKDSGIGIAKHQHELIFEAFRQADGTTNRKYGGTGLGLSISRNLTQLLGGTLTLESEEGRGSTFTLTVPQTLPPGVGGSANNELSAVARPALPLGSVAPLPLGSAAPLPLGSAAPLPLGSAALMPSGSAALMPPLGGGAALAAGAGPSPLGGNAAAGVVSPAGSASSPAFADDRDQLDRRRRFVLVIEDDVAFARILSDLAHELGFQCIVAHDAATGLQLAATYVPSAIVLDVNLPDHSGLSVLDRVKRNPTIRHIPVHVVTAVDVGQEARQMGAVNFIGKPALREDLTSMFHKIEERLSRRVRRLLIVEDDEVQRESLAKLLGGADVEITAVGTVSAALAALGAVSYDCVVTDLKLPGASGFELLEKMAQDESYAFPPVIVYTGRMLSKDEEQRLLKYSSSIIVKGARSPERLIDEVTLFLHQVEAELPVERQRILSKARDREGVFEGRQILVVEDDVRNIFALSSLLEPRGAKVVIARNGREGLEVLEKTPGVCLVLMDIMMPEMDGLQATREIRKRSKWAKLPIIALTAKAMPDDQERCRQAGANDYIAKPLDAETLLSLIRVWLPK